MPTIQSRGKEEGGKGKDDDVVGKLSNMREQLERKAAAGEGEVWNGLVE